MKIAVIASSEEVLTSVKGMLEKDPDHDQFVYLQRRENNIYLDRLDLFSTNVLVLDGGSDNNLDLKAIAACTREHANPAIIYATSDRSEGRLIEFMHAGISEVINFPIVYSELHEAIERLRSRRHISSSYHPRGRILSFVSSKGGAGATLIAGNLGYSIATNFDKKVLFIDLHMQFGDAAFYLTETAEGSTLADIAGQAGLDSSVIASATVKIAANYYLLRAPDSPEKAAGINPQHIDNLLTVAIQDYDFIIVDLPRIVDAMSMRVLDRSDTIFTVLQPVIPYIRSAAKMFQLFLMLGYEEDKVSAVLNRMDKSVSISLSKIEDSIQKNIDWVFPNDFIDCMESVNTGIPMQKLFKNTDFNDALYDMAEVITGAIPEKKELSFVSK